MFPLLLLNIAWATPPSQMVEMKEFCPPGKCIVVQLESQESPPPIGSGRELEQKDVQRGFELKRSCNAEGSYQYIAKSAKNATWQMKVVRTYNTKPKIQTLRLKPVYEPGFSNWLAQGNHCTASRQLLPTLWPVSVPPAGSRYLAVLIPSERDGVWESRVSVKQIPQMSFGETVVEAKVWMPYSDEWDGIWKRYFGVR